METVFNAVDSSAAEVVWDAFYCNSSLHQCCLSRIWVDIAVRRGGLFPMTCHIYLSTAVPWSKEKGKTGPQCYELSYCVFPENKTGSYINFCSNKRIRAYFQGTLIFFHVQPSIFIQIQSCHLLLVEEQWWKVGFHLTGTYFGGRIYIISILKNHTRAYF